MNYKNGRTVLPSDLLEQLQEYVQGDLIYIPKKDEDKVGWGENSGAKILLKDRNQKILEAYRNGKNTVELASSFFLSEDSIRKILRGERRGELGSWRKELL